MKFREHPFAFNIGNRRHLLASLAVRDLLVKGYKDARCYLDLDLLARAILVTIPAALSNPMLSLSRQYEYVSHRTVFSLRSSIPTRITGMATVEAATQVVATSNGN